MPEDTKPTGPKKIVVNDFSTEQPTPPIDTPVPAATVQPTPPAAVETVPLGPAPVTPPPAEVPKFGELQPKVDAHPLFSGAKEPKPKNPRRWLKRTMAPLIALTIVLIGLYLAVDAGWIKGYSHLPFHVFKTPVTATVPTITPAKTTKTATTDPYAGWLSYTSKDGTYSFKHPSNLYVSDCTGGTSGNAEDNIYLLTSTPPDCSVYGQQGGGPPVWISLISSTVATQDPKWSDYTNVQHSTVTIHGISGTRTSFDYVSGSTKSGIYYSFSNRGKYWYFEDKYGNQAEGLQPDAFDTLIKTVNFK